MSHVSSAACWISRNTKDGVAFLEQHRRFRWQRQRHIQIADCIASRGSPSKPDSATSYQRVFAHEIGGKGVPG